MLEGTLEDFPFIIFILHGGKLLGRHRFWRGSKVRILENGSGWIAVSSNDFTPVTFYCEDILYRLDLQGKET